MQRRIFLLGTTLALATRGAFGAAEGASDAIVIGAGLAGLCAAHALEAAGLRVRVLEANRRVGGRLHTIQRGGLRFEVGAVEVGSSYARVMSHAKRVGVALAPSGPPPRAPAQGAAARPPMPPSLIALREGLVRAEQWAEDPRNPLSGRERAIPPAGLLMAALGPSAALLPDATRWLDAAHADLDVSLWDHLAAAGWSTRALEWMDVAANYTGLREVSALDVLRREALRRKSSGTLRILPGSQALPEAMASALAATPVTGAEVIAIRSSSDSATVACADGRRFTARHVVCTLPCGPLSRIAFDPLPPAEQRDAWRQRRYTPVTTAHFRPLAPFWERDGLPVTTWSDGPVERLFGVPGANGRIERLIAWINGAGAARLDASGESDTAIGERIRAGIEAQRPAAAGSLELLAVKSWGRDPLAGGAYAEIAPSRVANTVAWADRALGRVHFAGEHTVFDEPGMEAALTSGERAAAAVLAAGG